MNGNAFLAPIDTARSNLRVLDSAAKSVPGPAAPRHRPPGPGHQSAVAGSLEAHFRLRAPDARPIPGGTKWDFARDIEGLVRETGFAEVTSALLRVCIGPKHKGPMQRDMSMEGMVGGARNIATAIYFMPIFCGCDI
ncbi:uncharacterized protein F4807DRAFT_460657 [Annulohypoxylon truncatum]|uniref:uncharacterized protein n=1 Tax=Annulohypoxylon truncatum TaxID=327061 RepID=UPI002008CA82|nr:uncharacterized protein F4807DRAFT_460657 [Annulohypoxylon truncatum]KAI1209442.1 hypothetical protein F4807DRAFT_460657 [Annulohypoxylon truncatum]